MVTIGNINWFNVLITLPGENELVMVTGDSGYMTHTKFLCLAYYDSEFRPPYNDGRIRWLDVQQDALMERGWVPTHWAKPIRLP